MKVATDVLVQELIDRTQQVIDQVIKFEKLSNKELNYRKTQDSWSILECLEHLNLYGDYYLNEIEREIKNSTSNPEAVFKSGALGNYFALSMLPKQKLNKMKTFADKNPLGSDLDTSTIDRFLSQQNKLLLLLSAAKEINLNKVKIATTISKLLKLKLGDTFRFVIYHNERHIVQAINVLKTIHSTNLYRNVHYQRKR